MNNRSQGYGGYYANRQTTFTSLLGCVLMLTTDDRATFEKAYRLAFHNDGAETTTREVFEKKRLNGKNKK